MASIKLDNNLVTIEKAWDFLIQTSNWYIWWEKINKKNWIDRGRLKQNYVIHWDKGKESKVIEIYSESNERGFVIESKFMLRSFLLKQNYSGDLEFFIGTKLISGTSYTDGGRADFEYINEALKKFKAAIEMPTIRLGQ